MLSKNEVKDIQSLSHKKFRDSSNLFIAEGPKIVGELLELVPQQIEKIYATSEWLHAADIPAGNTVEVSPAELQRISGLQTPNGVLAIIRKFETPPLRAAGFSLYLDTIQDPGNFGTIIRTADWFGVTQLVCSAGCADLYNPKVIQSTMASIARVAVHYDEGHFWLKDRLVPVYAAVLDGEPLQEMQRTGEGILIIGNESKGISKEVLRYAGRQLTIPRKGGAESLNAAVATGIILSHLLS